MKYKKVKKKFSFDFSEYDHVDDLFNSYYAEGGCVMTVGERLYFLTDEYKDKLNKYLEEFLKTALFKEK